MSTISEMANVGLRHIVQGMIQRGGAQEPCSTYWTYQPHRPDKPLVQPEQKK